MGNKFDFGVCEALASKLLTVADMIESENEDMRSKYIALNESFRDGSYSDYKSEFDSCDRNIKEACNTLKELSANLTRYADDLRYAL